MDLKLEQGFLAHLYTRNEELSNLREQSEQFKAAYDALQAANARLTQELEECHKKLAVRKAPYPEVVGSDYDGVDL